MDYIFVKSTKAGMEEYGSIYARVRTNGQNKKYAIGFTIKAREWEKFRSLQYTSSAIMTSIGLKYGQFASILSQIKLNLENNFDPDTAPAVIRSVKATVVNGEGFDVIESNFKKKRMLLADFITKVADEYKSGKRLKVKRSIKVSDGYINALYGVRNDILNFEKVHRRKILLDNVDMDFQRDLVKWYNDKGIMPNTISFRLSRIRTIMRLAVEEKLTTNNDFRNAEFVPKEEEVDEIYLNPDQIQALLDLDISTIKKVQELQDNAPFSKAKRKLLPKLNSIRVYTIQYTRDIFIVGCLTGQRISDYSRIDSSMYTTINGVDFIRITQEKTDKKVYIPLDSRVKMILNKYYGELPYVSLSTLNRNLRYLGELMHWTWKPGFDERRMGRKQGDRFCDMISSHTARRSFATNAHAAGIPLSSIMAVTGHSSEKTLRRYLRLEAEDKAIIAAKDFEGIIKM